jgi:hypothetical protein
MAILAIRRDGDQWAEGAEGGEVQRGEKLDQVETCLGEVIHPHVFRTSAKCCVTSIMGTFVPPALCSEKKRTKLEPSLYHLAWVEHNACFAALLSSRCWIEGRGCCCCSFLHQGPRTFIILELILFPIPKFHCFEPPA